MVSHAEHLIARARRHMQDAQANGWHGKSMLTDFALAALEAEGHDADNAASAVEVAYARHFQIYPPV